MSDLHPTVCLSDYIKDIKVASSLWMKESGMFPAFESWQDARLTERAGIWGIHLFGERKRHDNLIY